MKANVFNQGKQDYGGPQNNCDFVCFVSKIIKSYVSNQGKHDYRVPQNNCDFVKPG